MRSRYLDWYKTRMPRIHGSPGIISFLSSSVPEPWDLIHELPTQNQMDFRRLLKIPNPWGHPKLLSIIAKKYSGKTETIVLTQGATNAIFLLCQTLLKPGDHVLVEHPFYEPLRETPELAGARVEFFRRDSGTGIVDFDEFEKAVGSDTRLIILTNTHNPTGACLRDEDLRKILTMAVRKNPAIRILVDEVYLDFLDSRPSPACLLDPRFITVSSLTKVYGLNFLRCGWICGDPSLCREVRRRQVLVDGIGSIYLESLSYLVMSRLNRFLQRSLSRVNANRQQVKKYLDPLISRGVLTGTIPDHGCICFMQMKTVKHPDSFLETLEIDHNIYLAPGRFFGDDQAFRLGFGGDPEMVEQGLERLVEILEKAK